ncbi:hypothetical protein C8R46DRAFT_1227424 [Mycena filopes]|nr:hypothetical protein C8R46DRAFT_1227424 [Mycena filopes]
MPTESPPQPQQTIMDRIGAFVAALRPVFVKFIDNAEPVPKWHPPQDAIDFAWLEAQSFPATGGKPDLLLHNLGSFAEDPELRRGLDDIFEPNPQSHTFLVNTTGTGKTRSMLEGLCLYWGFYFVSVVDTNYLGSYDLENTIGSSIPNSPGFVRDLSTTAGPTEYMLALEKNRSIASKRFTEVLLARIIIFQLFIEIIQDCTNILDSEAKKLWLLIQLHPSRLGYPGGDFFVELATALRDSPTEWLQSEVSTRLAKARSWCFKDFTSVPFFLVLDEAQHAARTHFSAFRSENQNPIHRPVLREITSLHNGIPFRTSTQWFRSPHRLLNSFVKAYTGITPTDGQRWVEQEIYDARWPEALQLNSFDFPKLARNPNMEGTIIRIVNTDLVRTGIPTESTRTHPQ